MIEEKLDKLKNYYHCVDCGYLFSDKEYKLRVVKVGTSLDSSFNKYNITSGLCLKCYNDKLEVEK